MAEEGGKGKRAGLYTAAAALLALCIALGVFTYMPGLRQWVSSGRLHARLDRPLVVQKATLAREAPLPLPTGAAGERKAAPPGEATQASRTGAVDGGKAKPPQKAALSRPAGYSGRDTREMAYRALYTQWHVPYYSGKDRSSMCAQARSAGVRCLMGKGAVGDLIAMNRPAVLRFKDKTHGDYYGLLTALDGETATLTLGDETRTVDTREIAERWTGDYLLLWRAPPEYRGTLKPGSRGPAVAWIERQVALAQGRAAPIGENPIYDEKVKRQVRAFQTAAGVAPDGIAGPKTILRLPNAGAATRDPVLKAVRSEKGIR